MIIDYAGTVTIVLCLFMDSTAMDMAMNDMATQATATRITAGILLTDTVMPTNTTLTTDTAVILSTGMPTVSVTPLIAVILKITFSKTVTKDTLEITREEELDLMEDANTGETYGVARCRTSMTRTRREESTKHGVRRLVVTVRYHLERMVKKIIVPMGRLI